MSRKATGCKGGRVRTWALILGAGALLVLLVTPGAAAPGTSGASTLTVIAVQQAVAVDAMGAGFGRGFGRIRIPCKPTPRSPFVPPPWVPGPPPWAPGRPSWVPGPPPWAPGSPPWR